jgi:hypothetical protein
VVNWFLNKIKIVQTLSSSPDLSSLGFVTHLSSHTSHLGSGLSDQPIRYFLVNNSHKGFFLVYVDLDFTHT